MSGTTTSSSVVPASLVAGASNTSTTQIGASANDAQKNEFLKLLVAQLKNQDPMNPTDPTQFVSQLAQFSTVEQLTTSNATLNTISSSLNGLGLGQYAGMIGKTVGSAVTSLAMPTSGSPASVSFAVTSTSLNNVQVAISDSTGKVIDTVPVVGTSGTFSWDGNNSGGTAMSAGTYSAALVGTDGTGASQSAGTLSTTGVVSQVLQGTGSTGWQLELKDGSIVNATSVTSVSSS